MPSDKNTLKPTGETGLRELSSIVSQKQRLSDFVYNALCESIVKGKLKPGQRLREASVASRLEVSRTPVREAFARLESQHLLGRDPNGAYLVAVWDRKILREVATLRGTLEGFAAHLASQNMKPADFDFLQSVILQMESASKRKDYETLIDLDIDFHSCIWQKTGHTLLLETLTSMKSQIRFFMYLTRPGDEETYGTDHQKLSDALRQGNPEKGASAVKEHILLTAEHAVRRMKL
jgi:DNA-binding GntR family transcriptional regulator